LPGQSCALRTAITSSGITSMGLLRLPKRWNSGSCRARSPRERATFVAEQFALQTNAPGVAAHLRAAKGGRPGGCRH
jgi:hypothetical protein